MLSAEHPAPTDAPAAQEELDAEEVIGLVHGAAVEVYWPGHKRHGETVTLVSTNGGADPLGRCCVRLHGQGPSRNRFASLPSWSLLPVRGGGR